MFRCLLIYRQFSRCVYIYIYIYIYIDIYIYIERERERERERETIVGNGHDNPSSNTGQVCLHFT